MRRESLPAAALLTRGIRVTALAAVVFLLGACGDQSTSSSAPTTIDPRSPTQLAADKTAATSTVLKLDDLPPGWTAQPSAQQSPRSAEQRSAEAQFAECAGVDSSVIGGGETSPTRARSDEFSNPDNHQLDSSATVVATTQLAREQLDSIRNPAVPGCLAKFVNRAVQSIIGRDSSPGSTQPSGAKFGEAKVGPIDLPRLHAAAVAYRATIPVTVQDRPIDLNLDYVLALVGRTEISMTFTSFGAPLADDLEVELTNKVIDRAPPA